MSTMSQGDTPGRLNLTLAHYELRVADLSAMLDFYVGVLGFTVTDRSHGEGSMVFLSATADEHHQIVLAASDAPGSGTRIDHFAFRMVSLDDLHRMRERFDDEAIETVSHGTSWSVYVRDPEGNRLEFFVDTPWHVAQPARWEVDFDGGDDSLIRSTRQRVEVMPGFTDRASWGESLHSQRHGGTA